MVGSFGWANWRADTLGWINVFKGHVCRDVPAIVSREVCETSETTSLTCLWLRSCSWIPELTPVPLVQMKRAVLLAALAPLVSLPGAQAGVVETWVGTIWNDFKEAIDCGSCQVRLFKTLGPSLAY